MIHELIFALNGFPGRIFIHNKDNNEIFVDPNISMIHPSEVSILNGILKLASSFLKLQQFVEQDEDGLYLSAFKNGISEVLDDYRKLLIDIERELMADPHLTVAYVQCRLQNYQLIFFTLIHIIEDIKTNQVCGVPIMNQLFEASSSGDPLLAQVMLNLFNGCCQVFYYQLAAWLFRGKLPQQEKEFFICEKIRNNVVRKDEDENNTFNFLENEENTLLNDRDIFLNSDLLPIFISPKVGQQILFIGESVSRFHSHNKDQFQRDKMMESEDIIKFSGELKNISEVNIFPIERFEEFIENIRSHISQKLYKVIVINYNLTKQLQLIKEFFLMGRGELYLAFINQVKAILHLPISKTTQHDVNLMFEKAAHDVFLDDDEIVKKFKFIIADEGTAEDTWSCLTLTYDSKWPFHTIFTKDVLAKYNQLLRFLVKIKRVELGLHRVWMVERQRKTNKNELQSFLRHHMAFLVNNFQYYLQVDVIESQFNILMSKMSSTNDFEEIILAHDRFLFSLLTQCFLNADVTHKCCNMIFNLCMSFCRIILNNDSHVSKTQLEQLQDISKSFGHQSRLLLQMLSSVQQRNKHSHLSQLLLRIDFNQYFTKKTRTL